MENSSLNNWLNSIQKEIRESSLFNVDLNSNSYLKIMEDDFLHLFDVIKKDYPLVFVSLETSDYISINTYRKSKDYALNNVFTSLGKEEQKKVLDSLIEVYNKELNLTSSTSLYLSFGLLKYSLNPFSKEVFSAPLIFLPIEKFYLKDNQYFLKVNYNDILLNDALIYKIKKERSIDLSYPIDTSFNISSYLYYVNGKVKPLNWNVSNTFLVGSYPISKYYDYKAILEHKEEINSKKLIKKLSYINSEFYNFASRNNNPLESKFLSVLELSNNEYSVLKKVASKNDLFLQTSDEDSSLHIVNDIILSYLLNNQKLLVVYSSSSYKDKLLDIINYNNFSDCILSYDSSLDFKKNLINEVTSLDKYLSYSTYKQKDIISEDIKAYYQSKNNFKSMINFLRTKKANLNLSINNAIELYYELDEYPLINVDINDAYRLNKDNLNYYLNLINDFSNAVSSLLSPINEHPFYGFNKKKMVKEDYSALRKASTKLTIYLNDTLYMLINASIKYSYPNVNNLIEFKALLNVLSFLDNYKYDISYLTKDDLDEEYDEIVKIKAQDNKLKEFITDFINKYTRRVTLISEAIINDYNSSLEKKQINKKIKKIIGDSSLKEKEISYIISSMDNYYKMIKKNHESKNNIYPPLIKYLNEDKLEELRNIINDINTFKLTLKKLNASFDIEKYYLDKSKDKKLTRKTLQTLFNNILENEKVLQEYFSKDIYNFEELDLDLFYNKVQLISSRFISINEYTSYYSLLNTLNNTYSSLGNELIKYDYKDYKEIFLKRFYYDFINLSLERNDDFNAYSKDSLLLNLSKFYSDDNKRKDLIIDILKDYLYAYVRRYNAYLNEENTNFKKAIVLSKTIPPLTNIFSSLKASLYNLKPCIFIPYNKVSLLLKDDIYAYDGILYLINDEMNINDILPSIYKGQTSIFVSNKYLSKDDIDAYLSTNNETNNLLSNVTSSLENVYYQKEDILEPLKGNFFDRHTKDHLYNFLINHGFNVIKDYHFQSYNVDLLVNVPTSQNKIGIILDHLSYLSPEEASSTLIKENDLLKKVNIIPYRIITSAYFYNEEIENNDLIDFIYSHSKTVLEKEKVVKKELLMDYLFPVYNEPKKVYFSIDKKGLSKEEVLLTFIKKVYPISLKELRNIFQKDIDVLPDLIDKSLVEEKDGFIFIPNEKVAFKRVKRNTDQIRKLDSVSKYELYNAVYEIVNNVENISKDKVIKMILLSLGYKKTNPELNKKLFDIITYLVEQNIILENNEILSKAN